jgi:hypothetical protein
MLELEEVTRSLAKEHDTFLDTIYGFNMFHRLQGNAILNQKKTNFIDLNILGDLDLPALMLSSVFFHYEARPIIEGPFFSFQEKHVDKYSRNNYESFLREQGYDEELSISTPQGTELTFYHSKTNKHSWSVCQIVFATRKNALLTDLMRNSSNPIYQAISFGNSFLKDNLE